MIAIAIGMATLFSGCSGHNTAWTNKEALERIAFAVSNYREVFGTFPPLVVCNASGERFHSWRVLVLPMVQANSFYDEYDFTSPWDSDANADLCNATRWNEGAKFPNPADVGEVYYEARGDGSFDTLFVALASAPLDERPYERDQVGRYLPSDQPFIIIEIKSSGIHWMEPRDVASSPGIVPQWKSLDEMKDQIVRSAEINKETRIRDQTETLRFLESELDKH